MSYKRVLYYLPVIILLAMSAAYAMTFYPNAIHVLFGVLIVVAAIIGHTQYEKSEVPVEDSRWKQYFIITAVSFIVIGYILTTVAHSKCMTEHKWTPSKCSGSDLWMLVNPGTNLAYIIKDTFSVPEEFDFDDCGVLFIIASMMLLTVAGQAVLNQVKSSTLAALKSEIQSDPASRLRELKKLHDEGLINEAEFTEAKKKILG